MSCEWHRRGARSWIAIGLDAGTVSLWCADAGGDIVQLGLVSKGSDWVTTSMSFSPDSRFLVCISEPRQELLERRPGTGITKTSEESEPVPVPEILIYDLELLVQGHEQEINDSVQSARRPASAPISPEHVEVQDLVLAYVSQRSNVWLEDILAHLRDAMGVSDMARFFQPRSTAGSIHDLAVECCQSTIAFLTKSKRASSSGLQAPGEREADVIFRREEAVIACQSEHGSPRHTQKAQGRGSGAQRTSSAEMLDTHDARELEHNMCMVLEWLLSSSKLFQIAWNSYVFSASASSDESIAVGSNGRLAAKVTDTEGTPSLLWLTPGISAASHAECEFLIEKWTALSPDDGLRIGIVHRSVSTAGRHHHRAKVQYETWMYGCGNGMRFHTKNGRALGDTYSRYSCKEGDKLAVVFNRVRGSVSIKINGQSQGVMFDDIAERDNLFVAIEFMCKGETVRIPEVFVSSGWRAEPCLVELDALQFHVKW